MPQDLVALHAAIGSHVVREAMLEDGARISIWRSDPERNVKHVSISVFGVVQLQFREWTVYTDAFLLDRLRTLRDSPRRWTGTVGQRAMSDRFGRIASRTPT